ncbi:MAG: hypothetical protein J6T51_04825 [Kiritimatiellae bacterium]|nr:hypothetical protein [Kiritimatiellia bacterium]
MATVYKKGSWAEHGRVMPGKRVAPKIIDQILENGDVVQVGDDQKFIPAEMKKLLYEFFPDSQVKDGRIYLPVLSEGGMGICFYTRNVYHLGGNWSSEKKRIQIGEDFPLLYTNNLRANIETVLLGIYHYYPSGKNSGVLLFVCFSSTTYAGRRTHNSAAHIHTIDLLNAFKNGVYRRIDNSGNELLVLNKENFIKHINGLRGAGELPSIKKDREVLDYLGNMFDAMPRRFLGIDCFKEMMAANDKSRMNQGAWEGWYYEFYVRQYLSAHPTSNIVWWSKKGRGELDFDLRFPHCEWFYGDVKSDAQNKAVQGNLKESVDFLVLEKGGRLWYVAIEFTPERDADHGYVTTKWWNTQLGKLDRLMSYCNRMKYAINVNRMDVYEITRDTIPYLKEFRPSPCDGRERKLKYKIPNKMKEFLRIYERV